jgi:acyl-CoA synthetase (AMP-forming)/AMP-acid ligase II
MTTLAATAAAASVLYYANHRIGITKDIINHRSDQYFGTKLLPAHISRLGSNETHLYRMLELADPHADAIWFEGRTWNYRAVKAIVDEIALGLHQSCGVKDGDIVAVFMTNSPEFVFTVYALTRLGAAPALINNALRDETLLHCVRLPDSQLILATPDLAEYAASAAKNLGGSIKTIRLNCGSYKFTPLEASSGVIDFPFPDSSTTPSTTLPPTPPKTMANVAALIYTSGTTGKPKACSVKNGLIMVVSCPVTIDVRNRKKYLDNLRIYSCMPLFHGTTFFAGLCYSVGNGGCFCFARKFSARNYWKDVGESRATRVLYVGELCRFLLATPKSEYDTKHSVITAAGNGLQKDVWIEYQRRFNVPEVREFYRSTEGLVKFDNIHQSGKPGAGKVGYLGPLRKRMLEKNQFIVKFDYDSEQPIRDPATGFCVVAKQGEPGEAIARILNMATYTDYHNNTTATEQKLLRNAFETGDVFQRSGDLLVQESDNWVKFVDRIGDTYRWMGENVSAGEVRGFISELPGVKDAVVVGKRLNKYDGQAGTALIVLDHEGSEKQGAGVAGEAVFMSTLFKVLRAKGVPRYAVPRLVMVRRELVDVGDTFKHAKAVVKGIDWSASAVDSKKYYLDVEEERFKELNQAAWSRIQEGKAKL